MAIAGRKPIDLTNKKFGNLTILEIDASAPRGAQHNTKWLCKCICGKIVSMKSNTILKNRVSCGCQRFLKDKNKSCENQIYYQYKSNAKRRNIEWDLDREKFFDFIYKPCYYCGYEKSSCFKREKMYQGMVFYNGVDRIDSSLGYIESNCVTCCKFCNRAKLDYSLEEFLKWMNHLKKK